MSTITSIPKFLERTTQFNFHPDFWDAVEGAYDEAFKAIGYLTTWALVPSDNPSHMGSMSLFGRNDGDLCATYRDANGEMSYFLAGIFHKDEGRYSFHS